jgi:hypothetical protein
MEDKTMARPYTYAPGTLADMGLDPAATRPVPLNYRTPGARRAGIGPSSGEVLGVLSAMDRLLL